MSKTQKRTNWIKENKQAIESARTPLEGSSHNARYNRGMSGGGFGWWSRALKGADVEDDAMPFWSGSSPTPSTAINKGVARFISKNAPEDLR